MQTKKPIPKEVKERARSRTHGHMLIPPKPAFPANRRAYKETAALLHDYGVTPQEVKEVHEVFSHMVKGVVSEGIGESVRLPYIGLFEMRRSTPYQRMMDAIPAILKPAIRNSGASLMEIMENVYDEGARQEFIEWLKSRKEPITAEALITAIRNKEGL